MHTVANTASFCDSFLQLLQYQGWNGQVVGGGVGIWVGWKLKASYTIHMEANYNVVSLVGHRNSNSEPGRTRRLLAAV